MTLNPLTWYKNIKALWVIKGEVSKMKISELSTSSGRTMWLTNLVMIFGAFWGLIPAALAAKIIAVVAVVYMVYRTIAPALEALAKMTPTPKDDAVLAELSAAVKLLTDKFGTPKDAAASTGVDNIPQP